MKSVSSNIFVLLMMVLNHSNFLLKDLTGLPELRYECGKATHSTKLTEKGVRIR